MIFKLVVLFFQFITYSGIIYFRRTSSGKEQGLQNFQSVNSLLKVSVNNVPDTIRQIINIFSCFLFYSV